MDISIIRDQVQVLEWEMKTCCGASIKGIDWHSSSTVTPTHIGQSGLVVPKAFILPNSLSKGPRKAYSNTDLDWSSVPMTRTQWSWMLTLIPALPLVNEVLLVVRSAGTSGGPSRKKKHPLPARSNAASSLEESRQCYKVSTFGSSGPRTDSGLCRGLKSLQVVPRRVLRTHFLFVINIFVRAFYFCCVLVEFFLLFLSRGCVTTWRYFCFLSAIFLSIYLFFFGTLCLFVIFPV